MHAGAWFQAAALVGALAFASAAHAAQPFLIDDGLIDAEGQLELDILGTATWSSMGKTGVLPSVEVDYGVPGVPRLQLHARLPFAFNQPTGLGTQWGVGDAEIGAKFRIDPWIDDPKAPAVAVEPFIDFPSGDASRGLGTGRTHAFLPVFASIQLDSGVKPFGGGGYWINPGPGNRNYWFFGAGASGDVPIGGLSFTLGGEIFHSTPSVEGGKPTTGFDVGGLYNFNDDHHLFFTIGRGLQNANTTNRLTILFGYQGFFGGREEAGENKE